MKTKNGHECYDLTVAQRELSMGDFPAELHDKVNMLGFHSYIKENCDLRLLERCWNKVLERNDALRIRITGSFFKRWQYVVPYEYETFPVVKADGFEGLMALEKKERKKAVHQFRGAQYRVTLVDCGNGTGGMIACIHNIVCDGYSLELIFDQLEEYYALGLEGREFPPYKERSYLEYMKLEKKYMASQAFRNDKEWWKNIYRSLRHYSIPVGIPSPLVKTDMIVSELGPEVYDKIDALADRLSTTSTNVVMTAMALTTWQLLHRKCFCFYNLSHGRRTAAMKQTVGCITSANPIFFRIDPSLSFAETAKKEYMSYLEELSHGRMPCLNHFFMGCWNNIKNGWNMNDAWMFFSPMGLGNLSSKSRLGLECFDESELEQNFYCAVYDLPEQHTFRLEMNYQHYRYRRSRMERMKAAFEALLIWCLDHPDSPLTGLPAAPEIKKS